MLANRMKVFSERDIDIAISSISGASYKEIAARHNLSVNRCKEIVDDVMFRVYISEGMELHNQYHSTVHPHRRGEHRKAAFLYDQMHGSSPQARGTYDQF